jgi:membrane protein DedA with SNARE-associated domain
MEFDAWTDALTTFVKEHRTWAPPIVLVLAFCESLAFISLVLPFWTILIGIGAIYNSTGSSDFWLIVTAAAVGAALGDWLSFWLGYHYQEQISRMWPISKYPNLLPNGHKFFEKWGPWAILLGRFSGPLRASVPIVAGVVKMPTGIFQIANWASAVVWAFSLMLFGDAISKSWVWARAHFGM